MDKGTDKLKLLRDTQHGDVGQIRESACIKCVKANMRLMYKQQSIMLSESVFPAK